MIIVFVFLIDEMGVMWVRKCDFWMMSLCFMVVVMVVG